MTKIDKVLRKLSELYEFDRRIKGYVLRKKGVANKPIQPTRNTRG